MKYLVTGVSGFVGSYLVPYLAARGHKVFGVDAAPVSVDRPDLQSHLAGFHQISLMDRQGVGQIVTKIVPDRVIHLASASSVALSWQSPVDCFINNTNIFLNLVETLRQERIKCRVLSVGSSEEYGPVTRADVPLKEGRPVDPMNPYSVARVAQEQLSKVYAKGYGLNIVCTRSFNHLGPGQSDRFVISSFVRQAVETAQGKRNGIVCGDVDIVRDFIDVRDVIRAYDLLLEKGVSGEIYNVCRGKGTALREVLELICRKVGIPSSFKVDRSLIRPIDNPVIVGSSEKLRELGFRPDLELAQSIGDMVLWWRNRKP